MPEVLLYRKDCDAQRLPMVCMVCGEKATATDRRLFVWYPKWVYYFVLLGIPGLLAALIIAYLKMRTQKVAMPLCEFHKQYWRKYYRTQLALAILVFALILTIVCLFIFANSDDSLVVQTIGILILCSIFFVTMMYATIKIFIYSKLIDGQDIIFENVSRVFAQSLDYTENEDIDIRDDDHDGRPRIRLRKK